MVFAKQISRQTRDQAGWRRVSVPPACARQESADNKLWFLQNKSPDKPATKPDGGTRPSRRPMPGRRAPTENYGFCKTKLEARPRRPLGSYSISGQSTIWTLSLAPSSATGSSSGTIARPFA